MVSTDWMYGHKSMGMPLGSTFMYTPVYGTNVADGRNAIAQKALDENADYVFFNDDDVIVQQDTLHMLHRSQKNLQYTYGEEHKNDMVTGVYWGKGFPPEPLIFRSDTVGDWNWRGPYHDWVIGDFIEIDAAGCGAVLIPTEVFRRLKPPWFRLDYDAEYKKKLNPVGTTEDLLFYRRCREELGISLWCDTWVQLGHWDKHRGITFRAPMDAIQLRQRFSVVEGSGTILHIGSGTEMRQFPEFENVIRVDSDEKNKPDLVVQYDSIPLTDGLVDVIYSKNILNKYPIDAIREILLEWMRVLKIGGILHLELIDLEYGIKLVDQNSLDGIYGTSSNRFRSGFTKKLLTHILEDIKLDIDSVWSEEEGKLISIRATKNKEY